MTLSVLLVNALVWLTATLPATTATGPLPPPLAEPRLTAEVAVAGDVVTVQFHEVGLVPGQVADVAVTVTSSTTTECVEPASGAVLLSSSSSATAIDTRPHVADAAGEITATRDLVVAAGAAHLEMPSCSPRTTRLVAATVEDLATGARVVVEPAS